MIAKDKKTQEKYKKEFNRKNNQKKYFYKFQ